MVAAVQSKAHGHAEVLKCLVQNYSNITDGCQTEMSRAVRMALWEYKPSQALTGIQLKSSHFLCSAVCSGRCPKQMPHRQQNCHCPATLSTASWLS